jgi:hypothetical protein
MASTSIKTEEHHDLVIEVTSAPPASTSKKDKHRGVMFHEDPEKVKSMNSSLLGKNLASPGRGDNTYRPMRERFYKNAVERLHAKRSLPSSGAASMQIHVNQYLACAALGLDYLAANLNPDLTSLPVRGEATHVEVDDLLVAAEAPWSLAADHPMTLQELFRVVQAFIAVDVRFKGKYEATCLPLHVSRVDSNTLASMLDDEVCSRERPLTLSTFRQSLSEDALTFDRIKILCFEPELLAEAMGAAFASSGISATKGDTSSSPSPLKSEAGAGDTSGNDGDEDSASGPTTAIGGVALVTEIQRSRGSVSVAQVIDGQVVRFEVMARQLYQACVTRHKELRRVQGIIDIRRIGSTAAMNIEVSMMAPDPHTSDGHSTNPNSSRRFSELMQQSGETAVEAPAECVYGTSWLSKTQWRSAAVPYILHDTSVLGSHITTTALVFHLCNPAGFPYIPTNDLVQVAGLNLVDLCRASSPEVNSWYGVVKYFAQQSSPDTSVHFIPCGGRQIKSGLSLQQLIDLIHAVAASVCKSSLKKKLDSDEEDESQQADGGKNPAALLVSIDVNKARGSLNLTSAELNENVLYVIVGGISESGEQVLLIDGDTKHSVLTWRLPIETFHSAIVGNGVLLLQQNQDCASLLAPNDRKELLAAEKALHLFQPQPISGPTSAAEARALPTPIGLCCMACERLGHPTAQKELLLHLPANVSHLLVNDPSVEDLARLFNFTSVMAIKAQFRNSINGEDTSTAQKRLPRLVCRAIRIEFNRVKHRKMTGSGFAHAVRNALACGSQVLFHFKRALIPNVPAYDGAAAQYALAEGLLSNDVVSLQDTNPRVHLSRWTCSLSDIYRACSADCCATRRSGGLLIMSSSSNADALAVAEAIRHTRRCSPFYVPSSHSFRSPLIPQLTAVAMGAHLLGVRICPEQLLYSSANSFDMKITDAVARIVTLNRRILLADLCLICNAHFEANGLHLSLQIPPGSSRNGRSTKSDTHATLSQLPRILPAQNAADLQKKDSTIHSTALIGVYDVREARDVSDGFLSAAVLVGIDPADDKILMVEADPASWGAFLKGTVDEAVEWLFKAPDDPTSGLFGLAVLKSAPLDSNQQPDPEAEKHKRLARTKSGWSSEDEDE